MKELPFYEDKRNISASFDYSLHHFQVWVMETWVVFDDKYWSTDYSKKVLTKRRKGWNATAYGAIPMHCNGANKIIHTFEIKVESNACNMVIGIDEGRTGANTDTHDQNNMKTNHYGQDSYGYLYQKGNSKYCGVTYNAGDILKIRIDEGKQSLSFAVGNADFKEVAKIQRSNTPYYLAIQCNFRVKIATLQNYSCSGMGNDEIKKSENEVSSTIPHHVHFEHTHPHTSSPSSTVHLGAPPPPPPPPPPPQSLKQEIADLRARNQSLEQQVSKLVRNLRAEKQQSQKRVEELSAEKEAATNEHRQDNDRSRREIARLNEELEVFKGKYFDSEQEKTELGDQIETMQEQVAVLMDEKQEMNVRNQSLMQQVLAMQREEKQREEEVKKLKEEVKRLKLQCIDETQYEQWSHEEIAAWILSLDNGRLKQYEQVLREHLKEEEVDGQLLHTIDGSDVKRWGIIKMRDFKYLQSEIQRLVTRTPEQGIASMDINALANEGDNAAPTAFV